ncbi:aspartate kinase [Longibacter salinarum]|uniref:Aspartokinase n=1 Tax=Longibacter salinarum TaxID=1850348 RepID=A0A2A8CW13_9BACT|nr:aspartate kinase [Longibacter salinarum]PEN12803.1 aspartate kinase [Longibacter salinarum]
MSTAASPSPISPSSWSNVPLAARPVAVLKFGGSSVGSPETFSTVVDVVSESVKHGPIVVIASALARVTRLLSGALENFTTHHHDEGVVDELVDTLRRRHLDHAEAALRSDSLEAYRLILDDHLSRLRTVFGRVREEGFSPALRDSVLAAGEQMSVPILTLALQDAGYLAPHCDATQLVVTDDAFGGANVQLTDSADRIRRWYGGLDEKAIPVVAGFIGATRAGTITTLGFEGSDYSAALFAAILEAGALTRYTDVNGLYTSDPNTDANAERLDRIDMEEAYARTESGALGMHPKTLRPLVHAGIPMQVRSILRPQARGTCILPTGVDLSVIVPPVPAAD